MPGRSLLGVISEKQGIAVIVGQSTNVIDLEMAIPDPNPITGRQSADRMDVVALERSGPAINIVFYEAKLFSNPALRARSYSPKVLEQLDGYENWLTDEGRKAEVVKAYRNACGLLIRLRKMQGVPVDKLIKDASMADSALTVDPKPRLIIFGTQTTKGWLPHEDALRQAGVTGSRLIIEDHPKDVELPKVRRG